MSDSKGHIFYFNLKAHRPQNNNNSINTETLFEHFLYARLFLASEMMSLLQFSQHISDVVYHYSCNTDVTDRR